MKPDDAIELLEALARRFTNPPALALSVVEIVRRSLALVERLPAVVFLVLDAQGAAIAAYSDVDAAKHRAAREPNARVRRMRVMRADLTPDVVVEGDDE